MSSSLGVLAALGFLSTTLMNAPAFELIGTGTEALLGTTDDYEDLTDPENDGDPEADENYNAVFAASEEEGFGGGEFAFNVFDNTLGPGNAKWCCGSDPFPDEPVWVQATFEQGVRLSGFTISSANDIPGRDPLVWEIQGSNDDPSGEQTFETIYRHEDETAIWEERLQVALFLAGEDFPRQSKAYTTLRFICFQTGLDSGARYQLGELEFFGAGESTLTQGLLGYWSFNDLKPGDTETLDANNSAPEKSNGTVNGDPELVEGPAGEGDVAIRFDGVDDSVVTEGQILNDIDQFTMSGWVKFDRQGGNRIGFFGQNDSVEFGIIDPDTIQHWSAQGGAFNIAIENELGSNGVVSDWTSIVLVNTPDQRLFYVNGEEFATGGGTNPANSGFTFNIGGDGVYDASGNFFAGDMDDIAVWNRALTPAEIEELFLNRAVIPPDVVDTDGDGMGDAYETDNGLDPFDAADRDTDLDGDGLSNFTEFDRRTNPNNPDTDDDGLGDEVETNTEVWVSATDTGTNPNRADTDRDGLIDSVETNTGTFVSAEDTGSNPLVRDTDGDGAVDGLEVGSGFDPNDPKSVASIHLKGGTFTVRHVDTSGTVSSREDNEAILAGDGIDADEGDLTVQRPFLNFVDDQARAFRDTIEPYPLWGPDGTGEGGPAAGGGPNHEDFAIEATGSIFIQQPGGQVTIGVNSDDGFVLWIDGEEVGDAPNRGRGDTLMTVDLEAGQHDLRLIHWERGGGAGMNMFIARGFGEITSFNEGDFELLNAFDIALAPLEGDDSDNDQMADIWESFYFGDLSKNGNGDEDSDGLSDLAEYQNRGNPTEKDTDGDGLEDGPEVNDHGSSPASADTDGDSLTDADEVNTHGTDPALGDTDGDGSLDPVELLVPEPTDPLDPNERPAVTVAVVDGPWDSAATWDDGLAPSADKDYLVLNALASRVVSANGTFGGRSLTIIGSQLQLDHTGEATVNDLRLTNAEIISAQSNTLSGRVTLNGPDNRINPGSNTMQINARLTGTDGVTFVSGSIDESSGEVLIEGFGSSVHGQVTIIGTSVGILSDMGLGGEGDLLMQGGGLALGTDVTFCGDLLLEGGNFTIILNNNLTVRDIKGVGVDFSVRDLLGITDAAPEVTPASLINDIGFGEEQVSGDGVFVLLTEPECSGGCGSTTTDADGDGLSEAAENCDHGTSDDNPDFDGDGVNDGDEVADGSNPRVVDSDGDGLSDGEEKAGGTSPISVDSDDDGWLDSVDPAPLDAANPGPIAQGPPSMIGYWTFDQIIDGSTPDSSAQGNNGTLNGEPEVIEGHSGGAFDSALRFDGTDDSVTTGVSLLNGLGVYTMSGWVRFTSEQGNRTGLFGQNDNVEFGMINANQMQHWVPNGGALNVDFGPTAEEWTHIGVIATETERILFINGVEAGRAGNGGAANSGDGFNIGGDGIYDNSGNYFNGDIDDVAVWDVALAPEDIAAIASGEPPTNYPAGESAGFAFDPSFAIPDGTAYDVEYSPDLESPFEVIATGQTGVYIDTNPARNAAQEGFYRGRVNQ